MSDFEFHLPFQFNRDFINRSFFFEFIRNLLFLCFQPIECFRTFSFAISVANGAISVSLLSNLNFNFRIWLWLFVCLAQTNSGFVDHFLCFFVFLRTKSKESSGFVRTCVKFQDTILSHSPAFARLLLDWVSKKERKRPPRFVAFHCRPVKHCSSSPSS